MAKLVGSLKNLSVENGAKPREENNQEMWRKNKLSLAMDQMIHKNHQGSPDCYIVSICGSEYGGRIRIGVLYTGLNREKPYVGGTCEVYTAENLYGNISLSRNDDISAPNIGIKFSPSFANLVYIAGNGCIKILDLRTSKIAAEFKDNTEDSQKRSLISFDVSCDDRLMACGTEYTGGDAFILFWDIRCGKSKIKEKGDNVVGGYWESHTDDITSLAFNPVRPNVLASGSTDGLINIFDLAQSSEDAALTYTLNTESSVDKLGWSDEQSLWCTTHTHDLQLWHSEDANPYTKFERNHLAVSPNDDPDDCYVVRYHPTKVFGHPFLLTGSSTDKGENLKCLNITNDRLETRNELMGNKQIVRDSWVHEKSSTLWTTGEGCIINVWRQKESEPGYRENSGYDLVGKIGTEKDREHRAKPY